MESQARQRVWRRMCSGALALCIAMAGIFGIAGSVLAQPQLGCTATGICVTAGPRLASVDTAQGPLLNLLLQTLLPNTNATLSLADWNALAGADINLNALLIELGADATLSNASEVLASDITLAQLQLAMADVLQADGNTLAAGALQALASDIGGLTQTIQLGDLLHIALPQGSLADIDLDVLDLVMGSVQLYNYENVLTTPSPVTISSQALGDIGLAGVANVQVWLQVVEPPVYECGPEGTEFHTAAIRIKINTDLVQGLDTQALEDALDASGIAIPVPLGTLNLNGSTVTASVLKLQVYGDIARAQGTISSIDSMTAAVTLQATPGLVNLYVGTIDDAVFFNRTRLLSSADLTPMVLTQLSVTMRLQLDPTLPGPNVDVADVTISFDVQIRAVAEGSPYSSQTLTFNPAYPQTQTLTCGSQCAGFFASTLLTSLDITMVSGDPVVVVLGGAPPGLTIPTASLVNSVTGVLETQLDSLVPDIVSPVLESLLGFVDDVLGQLGIGIGQGVFTVEGFAQSCAAVLSLVKVLEPETDPGLFNLSISQGGTSLALAPNVGNNGTAGPVTSTPGLSYDFAETAGTGTVLDPYVSTWACIDQAGTTVGSGTGGTFALTAPALTSVAQTITCRITNRSRQANLSITKSDGSATYTPGGSATYVITVSNAGPDAVTGAVVNDTLPAGATLSSAWSCVATNGTCIPASGGATGDGSVSLSVDLDANGQAQISVPVTFSIDPTDY
jgi:uncharacterized repeat protein (TIGR01451 family)